MFIQAVLFLLKKEKYIYYTHTRTPTHTHTHTTQYYAAIYKYAS